MSERTVDIAIIGAGTAGMAAYRETLIYTQNVALIDGGTLGTTCARVGCMPSKLLIAPAEARHQAERYEAFGLIGSMPDVDGKAVMHRVKSERDRFVGFVLESVDGFNQDHIIRENAHFIDDHTLQLAGGDTVKAKRIIIAVGSRPNVPGFFQAAGDRLIVNDDIFYMDDLPGSVAVFGAGVIGLELCQALHRLGVRVRLFGKGDMVGPLTDPVVRDYAAGVFQAEYPFLPDGDVTSIERDGDEVVISFVDDNGAPTQERFDYLLAATGRRTNTDLVKVENTSLKLDERGVPEYSDLSMRCGDSHIFIAGDAVPDVPLLHEAADEGRIAGENAGRYPDVFKRERRVGIGVIFSDPQIAMAGKTYKELAGKPGCRFEVGDVSFEDQGRARVMLRNKGILRVYGEHDTGLLLGAEMIGPDAEHLAHMLAWVIHSRKTVSEILTMPFYHPVVEEGLRTALRELNTRLGFGKQPPLRCIDCGPGG